MDNVLSMGTAERFIETFDPQWDWLLIESLEKTETEGGLALPDSHREEVPTGIVRRAGKGRLVSESNTDRIDHGFSAGDTIYFFFRAKGATIQVGGRKFVIMSAGDVIARKTDGC